MRFVRAVLVVVFILFFSGCDLKEVAHLVGEIELTLEVNTQYEESGVSMPEDYSVIISGTVDTSKIGEYIIEYRIINSEGETDRELTRIVNVVDSTEPDLTLSNFYEFTYGISKESDLIQFLSDNYYETKDLIVTSNIYQINPNQEAGQFTVTYQASDPSGNTISVETTVIFKQINLYSVFEYLYLNDNGLLISGYKNQLPSGVDYYYIQLSNGDSISITEENSVTYRYAITTDYGSGSIQLSAEFGAFNQATIGIHIGSGINNYTAAFVHSFDILADTPLINNTFSSYSINYLNIPKTEAEAILNDNLIQAIALFRQLIEEELNIKLK